MSSLFIQWNETKEVDEYQIIIIIFIVVYDAYTYSVCVCVFAVYACGRIWNAKCI